MKKFSLIAMLLLINALLLSAQVDKKYLTGAVPVIDGKVVLTRDIKVNKDVSNDQLFGLVKQWAEKEYAVSDDSKRRVLLTKEDESYVVCQGDDKLVFKTGLFMLDQAIMSYQLVVKTETGKCSMEMRNIKYSYQDYKELVPAEEMITDKIALNKEGTKLNRHYDKFRTFTLDQLEILKSSLIAELSQVSVEQIEKAIITPSIVDVPSESYQPAPSIKVEGSPAVSVAQPMETIPMVALTPATPASMVGYRHMNADQLTESIMNMFKENRVLVTKGSGDGQQIMTSAWSGMGSFGGKPVAMAFVNEGSSSEAVKDGEVFTISFYTELYKDALMKIEGQSTSAGKVKESGLSPIQTPSGASAFGEAWMVIECKKVLEQSSSESTVKENAQSKIWNASKSPKLYMGEIINVWAR